MIALFYINHQQGCTSCHVIFKTFLMFFHIFLATISSQVNRMVSNELQWFVRSKALGNRMFLVRNQRTRSLSVALSSSMYHLVLRNYSKQRLLKQSLLPLPLCFSPKPPVGSSSWYFVKALFITAISCSQCASVETWLCLQSWKALHCSKFYTKFQFHRLLKKNNL